MRTGTAVADPIASLDERLGRSLAAGFRGPEQRADFHRWFTACAELSDTEVEPTPLDELAGWRIEPDTGNLVHASGRFFSVEGIEVDWPGAAVPRWGQPIINQPETGILGLLVSDIGGVPHFLMQAKMEPGNIGGIQLSPTVQATRSNYTGAHQGRPVPYVEYFRDTSRHTVLADVRHSEQGAWFHRKRNRNMIVEVREPVEARDGYRWLTLGQIHELLALPDMVNMDSRAVLSCLPLTDPGPGLGRTPETGTFEAALLGSCTTEADARTPTAAVLSWITEARSTTDLRTRRVPLRELADWRMKDGRISHESGQFFDVMGVRVRARGREVDQWAQPLIAASHVGLVAFLARRIDGVLHVLVRAKAEPGHVDTIELAPTVQCAPPNYDALPSRARPPFLDHVLGAARRDVRFDTVLSEEGGRFYHTRNRYMVIETDESDGPLEHPGFRWMTMRQLTRLLRHSYYLNVEARTLVTCMRSLLTTAPKGTS
ncbi:NDP-hexose 2,3-dehydratase family protein [Streptomyces rubradiris]|uniref:NDP-hexose 2,3-dehydratase family protein n=1 Tax=Streptomyces rubradiris TaxID=285531 RepID=UPI0036E1428D